MNDIAARISRDPRFRALQRARARLAWTLSALVALAFYGNLLCIAFWPKVFAAPIGPDSPLTVGIVYNAGLIVWCVALTGIYVFRANRTFDTLNYQILNDAVREPPPA